MLTTERSVAVRDASDPSQVRRAQRLVKRKQARLALALRTVMATAEGRIVLWELIATTGVFGPVWSANGSLMNYNVGRQSVGRELLDDLMAVDADLYQLMEREMRALAKREDTEIEASHTPKAEELATT